MFHTTGERRGEEEGGGQRKGEIGMRRKGRRNEKGNGGKEERKDE